MNTLQKAEESNNNMSNNIHLDAKEARAKSLMAEKNIAGQKYIDHIHNQINKRCEQGLRELINPHIANAESGMTFSLSGDLKRAVRLHFETMGYRWVDHPDPDPGHPCSSEYTRLSW